MSKATETAAADMFRNFVSKPVQEPTIDPPVESRRQVLPLRQLPWEVFEQLCCRLVSTLEDADSEPFLYGLPGQAQKGIDIVLRVRRARGNELWAFQCRNVEGWKEGAFRRAIRDLKYEADHYIFMVACEVGTELQDVIVDRPDIEIWDARTLSRKLKGRRDIVDDFFGKNWVRVFAEAYRDSSTANSPVPEPNFVGRSREVNELADMLDAVRTLAVQGPAGAGKTQLVLNAFELAHPCPTAWIPVDQFRSTEALRLSCYEALEQLQEESGLEAPNHPLGIGSRIVLDGIEQLAGAGWNDLEHFLLVLVQRDRKTQVVLTTQVDLGELPLDRVVLVRPLSPFDALQILNPHGHPAGEYSKEEGDAITELVRFSAGHALTLRLVAAQARRFGSYAVVAARIDEQGAVALDRSTRTHQSRSTSLQIAFAVAFDALTANERSVLLHLSLLPAGIAPEYMRSSTKPAGAVERFDAEEALAELHRWHLVTREQRRVGGRRYRMLRPVQAVVLSQPDLTEEALAVAVRGVTRDLAIYSAVVNRHVESADTAFGVALLDEELPNLLAALDYSEPDATTDMILVGCHVDLAESLASYLFVRGHLELAVPVLQRGIAAAKLVRRDSGVLFSVLIRIQHRMHDLRGMRASLEEFESSSAEWRDSVSHVRLKVAQGDLFLAEGRFDDADAVLKAAQLLVEELIAEEGLTEQPETGENDTSTGTPGSQGSSRYGNTLALILATRAIACENMKKYGEALEHGKRALTAATSAGDTMNIANVTFHLARAHAGLQEFEEALRYYRDAALRFWRSGAQQFLTNALAEIGEMVVNQGLRFIPVSLETEVYMIGLDDMLDEIGLILQSEGTELNAKWAMLALAKSGHVAALASFASPPEPLMDWAMRMHVDVVDPLIRSRLASKAEMSMERVIARTLNLLGAAIFSSAQCRLVGPVSLDRVEDLCGICNQMLGPPYGVDPFLWLHRWLERYSEWPSVPSAQSLANASEARFEHGRPFCL